MVTSLSLRSFSAQQRKILALSALGGALEFYDFIIFVFFAHIIGQLFFPITLPEWLRQLQTFGLFAAGYLARPLGGIVLAHFGDLLGRKRMFTFSVFLMSVPTLMIGLLPTYTTLGNIAPILLLLLRILQGAAIGGEVPGAWVFISEHVSERKIGYACGVLTCGLTGGILLGSIMTTVINAIFSPTALLDYAWRLPFIIGGALGILSSYLRNWLRETPIFLQMQKQKKLAAQFPLKSVLIEHRRAVILVMMLTWFLSAAIVVVILMTPTLLQSVYHYPSQRALYANNIATLALTLGCIFFGHLSDRIGSGRTLVYGHLLFAICTGCFYYGLKHHYPSLLPLYGLAGFSVGLIGAIPYVMVKCFPAEVRFSGIAFAYNIAYAIFGGLTPIIVSFLLVLDLMAPAYYLFLLSMIGLIIGLFLCASERKEKRIPI